MIVLWFATLITCLSNVATGYGPVAARLAYRLPTRVPRLSASSLEPEFNDFMQASSQLRFPQSE